MWNGILLVFMLYLGWVGINSALFRLIEKLISHPKYSLALFDDGVFDKSYGTLILFVGIFLLPFRKRLRFKRMKEYYEFANERKDNLDYGLLMGVKTSKEEIENIGRYIKIKELKRKTRKKW